MVHRSRRHVYTQQHNMADENRTLLDLSNKNEGMSWYQFINVTERYIMMIHTCLKQCDTFLHQEIVSAEHMLYRCCEMNAFEVLLY